MSKAKSEVRSAETVKICGVDHKIIMKSSIEMPNELGLCHSDIQEIWLNSSNSPESMLNTLLHECIHTIDHAYDLDMSERQVTVLATALIAFARDNPEHAKRFFLKTVDAE
jgi:Zn-dependent peptidase ImmA (M78 family)